MKNIRLSIVLLAVFASGCSLLPQPAAEPPPVSEPVPETLPEPPPAPPPPPRRPEPAPPPPAQPEPDPLRVAVLQSSRAPAFESVARELESLLEGAEVYDLSDRSLSVRDAFDAIHAAETDAVVAIGLRAAIYARNYTTLPVVYSQVFNAADNDLEQPHMRGVAVIPPLDKQLAAWRAAEPGLRSVGAIVGSGHATLINEAAAAAADAGLDFHHRSADSDREALYLFTRMVPEIDAFWLFPDNRILSGAVLREMLAYASRHGVAVAVFNDRLLEHGAQISATSVEADVAATIAEILVRLEDDAFADVPALSPLSEIRVRFNAQLERRLRLASSDMTGRTP